MKRRARKRTNNALLNFFASCPDNAFQRVQPGMAAFSVGQRVGAIIRNGMKLLGVGFCASMLGTYCTSLHEMDFSGFSMHVGLFFRLHGHAMQSVVVKA